MEGKCCVCGKEGPIFVCASACGAMTNAYCEECLDAGAEPWGDLVFYISIAGQYPEGINDCYQEIVQNTCKRLGRTEAEFANAVQMERAFDI